jgi:nitrogen fixation/metabolism regulation signal transduction histidine kinase
MTTLAIPSLQRRLLETVREEVAAEPVRDWLPGSVQLCLDLLRRMRNNFNEMREELEKKLAEGVEARSFAGNSTSFLAAVDEHLNGIRKLVGLLTSANDAASKSMAAESRLLEENVQAFRDLLAKALSKASETPRSIDWEKVRAAEEAFARGETKPFSQR